MPKIVTIQSYNTIQFYQIPQAFYHNPKYIGMNPSSRETYAMLRNLLPLSINNGWINEAGEIYVKLSREKLMLRLGTFVTNLRNNYSIFGFYCNDGTCF